MNCDIYKSIVDSAKKFGKSILMSGAIDIGMKQMFNEEKETTKELDASLDRLFRRYCNGKKVTQRDRDKVGEILDRVERKTGRTLAQEVINLRRGK